MMMCRITTIADLRRSFGFSPPGILPGGGFFFRQVPLAPHSCHIQYMILYTPRTQLAIRFMVKTHEVYQKQKRKGKDIPYISHPLTVGLILARAGASEDVVIAGILHDTIEDSVEHKKVTRDMLSERFGEEVAGLVESVTELHKDVPWDVRKKEALEHIGAFSQDSVLVKSADVIANNAELLEDYALEGDATFDRFTKPKAQTISNTLAVIGALRARWPESPLSEDLENIGTLLSEI
jgi:(p)ppGpp synthase/HD superfamily hydrolase